VNINDVLVKPHITEKNTMLGADGKYTFKIDRRANKVQVREAVEKLFKVDVVAVNTIHMPSKSRRVGKTTGMTQPWRKAIVTLAPGQRIELFEGA
jgi:large subunit ribosomal protein L23